MHLTDEQLIQAIEDNEAECFSTFKALAKASVLRTESETLIKTHANYWLFNGVFRPRPQNAERAVDRWIDTFGELPFGVFLYPHSTSPELEAAMTKRGFEPQHASTLVVFDSRDLDKLPVQTLEAKFQIRPVRNVEQFETYAQCWSTVFQAPAHILELFCNWSLAYGFDESLPLQNIAVMHDGRAVAIAMYYLDSKLAGIYNIGVHPDFRRAGLGSQVTREIARLAQERGVRYLAGSATEDGLKVYRKANIREIGTARRWVRA